MSRSKKIILTILIILLLLVLSGASYAYFILNSITSTPIDTEKLGVNTNLDNAVINIAFFGIDGRDDVEVEGDRTDVIMIGTLNTKTNSLKLTSIMRDTYSKICIDTTSKTSEIFAGDEDGIEWEESKTTTGQDGQTDAENPANDKNQIVTDTETQEGQTDGSETQRVTIDYENQRDVATYDKINAAFNDAGVESSILTMNTNFDLNIEDYVTVDFNCLMDAVDALGGIELDIPNESVLYWTNQYLQDSNFYGHRNDPDLEKTGVQTLTGAQALAFARNRYSDSDFGRAERQREVVQAIFTKVKSMDVVTAVNLINKIYPYVQTSLSIGEITDYASKILSTDDIVFENYRIPTNQNGTAGFIDGVWYLFPDTLVENNKKLHEFIYEDTNYTPSNTVRQISQVINDIMTNDAYNLTYQIGGGEDEEIMSDEYLTNPDGKVDEKPLEEETPAQQAQSQEDGTTGDSSE